MKSLAAATTLILAILISVTVIPARPASDTTAAYTPARVRAELLAAFSPQKIKTRSKLRIMRYGDVDRRLADVTAWLKENCPDVTTTGTAGNDTAVITFGELFTPSKANSFFPLTNTVVRLAPESSLTGLPVCDQTGYPLGSFANKYPYTHQGVRSYTLYYFQYKTDSGALRRSGTDLLLDRFLVKWDDIRDKPLLVLAPAAGH